MKAMKVARAARRRRRIRGRILERRVMVVVGVVVVGLNQVRISLFVFWLIADGKEGFEFLFRDW